MGATGKQGKIVASTLWMERLMPQPDDLSRSPTSFVQGNTLVAVIELSLSSWLMTGMLPGVARQPLKKLEPDEAGLLRLLHRWQDEAVRNGSKIDRIVVA
jgi:transposase